MTDTHKSDNESQQKQDSGVDIDQVDLQSVSEELSDIAIVLGVLSYAVVIIEGIVVGFASAHLVGGDLGAWIGWGLAMLVIALPWINVLRHVFGQIMGITWGIGFFLAARELLSAIDIGEKINPPILEGLSVPLSTHPLPYVAAIGIGLIAIGMHYMCFALVDQLKDYTDHAANDGDEEVHTNAVPA